MAAPVVRIATRGSALARWQAEHVAGLLRSADPALATELVVVDTLGDRALDRPIWELGGQGVFVKEVQAAVLDGRADLAVHSAKDLPSAPALATPGLVIGSVPERGDARDALVGHPLAAIPPGGVVATGSTRRRAQLADRRPDLTFTGLRGNIDTRLARVGEVCAVVVAAAALERLDRRPLAVEVLDPSVMVPQVGQGALAIECRGDDGAVRSLVARVEHGPSRRAVDAERAYLACLGGGCELPVGAYAVEDSDGRLWLRAVLATLDGRVVLRDEMMAPAGVDPAAMGGALGRRLLDTGGGRSLLSDLGSVTLS
ncbi:MAG TPA: hydroxymethylbilane synthase [Acidimicrobiales bacterium]|nr:hydroxymethylbilane synthase [Acidimicrobiales bacterium]